MSVPKRNDREWRKSTYSGSDNQCVEVAPDAVLVGVRDTKARAAGELDVPAASWAALLEQVK